MALDFPSLPSDGQIFVDPTTGSKYVYEAATTKWKSIQHTGVITAYGFDKANAAFLVANAAFGSANNVVSQVTPAFTTANNAYNVANSAFNVANNALPNTSNAVFNGNLRITGTLQIGTNTVTITDESIVAQSIIVGGSPIPSGVTSNLAFDTANAAFASANNVAPQVTPAFNTANAAYTSSNSANSYANSAYVKLTAPIQTITGDLAITGNLSLLGNVTTLRSNNLVVNDSLIYLAANNDQSDVLDIGFVGHYSNGTANLHTGLFRDHNTKQYFLFNNLGGPEPETINDIIPYANGMINAVLNADIATSNLILGGANAINWITSLYNSSNSDYVVSNSAFATVNAAYASINSNWTVTNTVYGVANAAFGTTNTISSSIISNWTVTNAIYSVANAAYASVNSNWTVTNAIYSVANAAYASVNSNWTVTNTVYGVANAAYGRANTALQNTTGTLAGVLTTTGNIYAPAFYDSNDNNFYLNPHGGSQVQGHFRIGPYASSTTTGNVTGLEIMNNSGTGEANVAAISFHCQAQYGMHMHLRADGFFGIGGWSASTWRWYVNMTNGDMTAVGNVTAYSDPRLKEDVTPIESPLHKIRQLNGVRFRWKDNSIVGHPGEYDYGILADDVEKIAPEIVSECANVDENGIKYKTVAYDKLVPFLIEAIKELQDQIDELKGNKK